VTVIIHAHPNTKTITDRTTTNHSMAVSFSLGMAPPFMEIGGCRRCGSGTHKNAAQYSERFQRCARARTPKPVPLHCWAGSMERNQLDWLSHAIFAHFYQAVNAT